MTAELKRNVINMKSLDQDIKDPIVVGSGEANGRTLAIIFTQEAAAQIVPMTHVYLKWRHVQADVVGYNAFTQESEDPQIWVITFPKQMLREGDVLATIELVDDISIAASTTFSIHIMSDAYLENKYDDSDDFTEFQKAALALSTASYKAAEQMRAFSCKFAQLENEMKETEAEAQQATQEAIEAARHASEVAEYYVQHFLEIIEF